MQQEQHSIKGFVLLIEGTILYIIDALGDICLLNAQEDKVGVIKEKEYYIFSNLFYMKRDINNYLIYDMTKSTTINLINEETFFKKFVIIKFIALDQIIKDKDIKIELINSPVQKICHIKSKIQFISLVRNDDSLYFLQAFQLNINGKHNIFSFFIYKGHINSINLGLEENNLKTNKNYEIIFLTKEIINLPSYINVSNYKIKEYDKFNCTHRIRYNIMNVRADNKIYNYNTDLPSLEIIYLINENNEKIKYGVFDINSYKEKVLKDYIFDQEIVEFVNNFYNNYDRKTNKNKNKTKYTRVYFNNINQTINNTQLYSKLRTKDNLRICNYNKTSLDNQKAFNFFRNYYFYLYLYFLYIKSFWNRYIEYDNLVEKIDSLNYSNYDKIRILTEFILNALDYGQISTLVNISELDVEDPYYLAFQLQREIITNITETSNIFYPIIQFNSKILKLLPSDNLWDISKEKIKSLVKNNKKEYYAYTISLEDLEDMKSHLLSLQENFFFIFAEYNNQRINGKYCFYTKITTINHNLLCKEIEFAISTEEKKNYAFSINLVFNHEIMGHGKENDSNPEIESPFIFFNKNFQKDYIFKEENNYKSGESGRMFENFISSKCLVSLMKKKKRFGQFLDFKYFIDDFKEINKMAISEFEKTYAYYWAKSKTKLYLLFEVLCLLGISFYLLIRINSIKISLNPSFIIVFIVFSMVIYILTRLINENYRKYKEPYKYNELFNYTDFADDDENENGDLENQQVYPDDYPFESETFLGRYFPFLQFEENKIRRKLRDYLKLSRKTN